MRSLAYILGSWLLIVSGAVSGTEIYRWVDADGVVHFSDTKPIDEPSLTTIEIVESDGRDYDPIDDPYSILNQTQRIHDNWVELVGSRRERGRRTVLAEGDRAPDTVRARRRVFTYPLVPARVAPGYDHDAAERQWRALEALELSGPRSPSINSGAHRERVIRSQGLPIVIARDRASR